jgi:hypothetical protein
MDLKAIMDGIFAFLNVKSVAWGLAAILGFLALRSGQGFFRRVGRVIEETMFQNWRLALLGTTGLVLSLASGWTTWDGMKNFTGEPILSAMVTFGIQGVMLIVAWLIGEAFATGMSQQAPDNSLSKANVASSTGLQFALPLTLLGIAILSMALIYGFVSQNGFNSNSFVQVLTWSGSGLLLVGLFIIAAKANTLRSYFDATRVMVRTAVLWLMFLSCAATSVFFSFDSLFSTIFPQSERVRAAELRAQNQVSGIISDISATISRARIEQTKFLFETKGWADYDAQLTRLSTEAQGADKAIEAHFTGLMEERRRGIAQQQERITTAQSGQVGLVNKKQAITDELSRLKADRPGLADAFAKAKGDVEEKRKELDAKRVTVMAEERGVEGTGKIGKGAMYRERKAEEDKFRDVVKIAEERLRDAQKRFTTVDSRITVIERELSGIDGDIAKLRGEAQTAEQRIKLAEDAKGSEEGNKLDPSRILPQFERIRVDFRQTPKTESLGQMQQLCSQLVTGMASTVATKDRVRGIDCDPKIAAEAAAPVFAIDAGAHQFDATCVGGDKLAAQKSADDLFSFARKCAQDAGLPSKDTDQLRQRINVIELNRDDKANRFVVTWNAFQDGNRLAYLSLAIAIAIDSLVFMSGLFGANAVRSPLSDVPTTKARSAEQLEAIIENALLPEKFENAQLVLEAMRPITPREGYTAEVIVPPVMTPSAQAVVRVLNAGAAIGAVARDPNRGERYLVRAELFEFLSMVAKKSFESDGESLRLAQLKRAAIVALQPHIGDHAHIVLDHMHPISETDGFMSEVLLPQVPTDDLSIVRKVLNAGTSHNYVQRDDRKGEDGRYYVHRSLYNTVATIAATYPVTGQRTIPSQQLAGPNRAAAYGGSLGGAQGQIAAPAATRQLPPVAPNAPVLTDADLEALRDQYWGEMLASIGINSMEANRRLAGDGVQEAAISAWQALNDHAKRNRKLDDLLRNHRKAQEERLSVTYSSLLKATNANEQKRVALDQIDGELAETLPALMLFPETGLLNYLVDELERAARPDDGLLPGEQSLKDRLMAVAALMRLDLADVNAWRQIGVALGLHDDGASHVVYMQQKRNSGQSPRNT